MSEHLSEPHDDEADEADDAPDSDSAARSAAAPASTRSRYCPRCAQNSPTLEDGTCAKCRSIVIARTIPHGVAATELEKLGVSRPGEVVIEESPHHRVDPLIGLVIADRYRIVDGIGRGGMGVVYKVEHVRIGKLLAMKLLAGELSRNHEVVRRFKTEALTASKLSSPNTVQVFDYGVSEGLTYLVMELVSGDDLGRLLKAQGTLDAQEVGRIAIQIASSLAEAHAQGIVHRDIKPENVMILKGRDGNDLAKVLDFGLAKLREGSELSELTSQGAIVGTPYFMSPEQIRGEQVDARSDIYSLGALMYRALTGIHPFNGPSPMSVFAKHLTEMAAAPHEVNPTVPLGMSRLVMRALAKDPADRFQRAEDLQSAVVSELADMGTSGIEQLLDSGAIRKLEQPAQAQVQTDAIATRDEVEGYERKLKRTRIGVSLLAALIPLAGLGGVAKYMLTPHQTAFQGVESEPNNELATANAIPYGAKVEAYLGKRLSPTDSDIDFFTVVVPPDSTVSNMKLAALPNIPLCLQLFYKGQTVPSGQYCTGRSGVDLEIGALKLPPGGYVLAVIEDMDGYGEPSPFVHENVSDTYAVELGAGEVDPALEVEPNDSPASAQDIALDQTIKGTLGWVRDQDVFCPNLASPGFYRFRVEDDSREVGTVLSAATMLNGNVGPSIRIHPAKASEGEKPRKPNSTDVPSPYNGFSFQGVTPPCLRLQLVPDAASAKSLVPRGSKVQYKVTLEAVP